MAGSARTCRRWRPERRKNMTDITVLGLGAMGSALAAAFIAKGHSVTVWNRSAAKAEPLEKRGAATTKTIAGALAASPLIVVCLLTYDTVDAVLGEAAGQLRGKTLVNLTNGTPAQARRLAKWADNHGAGYVDGGIMAVPPMIGGDRALILYSGSQAAFDANRAALESLGAARYFGTDPGLASLHDLALLTGMYGLFSGALHAMALVGTENIPAREFMPMLIGWLTAMMDSLPEMAEQVDSGVHDRDAVSNLAMQAAGYPNLVDASREQGVSTELVTAMGELMRKGVEAGHGSADIGALVELLRKRT